MDATFQHRQAEYLTALEQLNTEALKIDDKNGLWAAVINRISGFLQMAPVCLIPLSCEEEEKGQILCSGSSLPPQLSAANFKLSDLFIRWLQEHNTPLNLQNTGWEEVSPGLTQDDKQCLVKLKASVCFAVKSIDGVLSGLIILEPSSTSVSFSHEEIKWVSLVLAMAALHLERIRVKNTFLEIQKQLKIVRGQLLDINALDDTVQVFREIAHDFNNILSGIIGRCELASGEKDAEKIKRHISSLAKAASAAQTKVQELRDLIESTAGKISRIPDLKQQEAFFQIERLLVVNPSGVDSIKESDKF